jgi:hypothetical protein
MFMPGGYGILALRRILSGFVQARIVVCYVAESANRFGQKYGSERVPDFPHLLLSSDQCSNAGGNASCTWQSGISGRQPLR